MARDQSFRNRPAGAPQETRMSSALQITPIPALRDNYVWMIRRLGGAATVIVDPGEEAPVSAALEAAGAALAAILVTHHHHDHVGGIAALVSRHRVPVYGPARESIPSRTHALGDGDDIWIEPLQWRLSAMHVPGHTLGAIAYAGEDVVFTGDTMFTAGCGRLFEGTAAQMHASLHRLSSLPPHTAVYCGHEYTVANLRFAQAVEPQNAAIADRLHDAIERSSRGQPCVPSSIAEELATNPFLRVDEPSVRRAASQRCGRPLSDPIAVFSILREWKNHF
jgi:hydroxyacylglutathione hydrolase